MLHSDQLRTLQNPDGGWPYQAGQSSWVEPTLLAMLALADSENSPGSAALACAWLKGLQREDGGLPPKPGVNKSTWVTALALFLPASCWREPERAKAADWLLRQAPEDTGFVYRLRMWMLGIAPLSGAVGTGWSWYPGTAGWLAPTAYSLLALGKEYARRKDERIAERIHRGQQYLMARQCADGGWNHGSSRALGYESDSYPETTGLALMALRGVSGNEKARETAIQAAGRHAGNCRSVEGLSMLQLGLLAQGRLSRPLLAGDARCYTTRDLALASLAEQALSGKSVFW